MWHLTKENNKRVSTLKVVSLYVLSEHVQHPWVLVRQISLNYASGERSRLIARNPYSKKRIQWRNCTRCWYFAAGETKLLLFLQLEGICCDSCDVWYHQECMELCLTVCIKDSRMSVGNASSVEYQTCKQAHLTRPSSRSQTHPLRSVTLSAQNLTSVLVPKCDIIAH